MNSLPLVNQVSQVLSAGKKWIQIKLSTDVKMARADRTKKPASSSSDAH